ncbi:hypothetical protein AB0K14_05300 [Actinosynnema sp. NPDC050801]|uniref:hypothetical protein n=1 Tax=unclassified Actinosynnema TaxID=2637065 RepID=UPI0033DC291C
MATVDGWWRRWFANEPNGVSWARVKVYIEHVLRGDRAGASARVHDRIRTVDDVPTG